MVLRTTLLSSLLVILLSLISSSTTYAFPGEAGDCPEGEAAVGGSHQRGNSDLVTTGSLEDGGLSLSINNHRLSTNEKFALVAGQTYDIALASTGGRIAFRGFLIRLGRGTNNIDTTDVFTVPEYMVEEIHVSDRCIEEYAVGGLTHMNPKLQNYVMSELLVEEESLDMTIDVTVVIKNQGEESIYYYSQFLIDVIETEQQDNDDVATAAPTTMDPSSSATMDPSASDSYEESFAPSSEAPSSSPAPSSVLPQETHSPTEEFVAPPTPAPPPKDIVGRCGETASFGKLQKKDCYSVDTGYCTWSCESMGCREISTSLNYYNGMWLEDQEEEEEEDLKNHGGGVWSNHTSYGQVTVYMDNCLDNKACEVYVDNHACQATCDNMSGEVTVVSCDGLPGDAPLRFEYFPQTIDAAERGSVFDMISTAPMCAHPSNTVASDRNGIIPPGAGKNGQTTKTMTFPTEMHFWFKDDVDDQDLNLDLPTRSRLFIKSLEYFTTTLAEDSHFKNAIKDVTVGQVQLTVADDDAHKVVVSFDTNIELEGAATATLRQAITKLANSNWNEYIQIFRDSDQDTDSVLEKIHKVFYKGIGRVGGR